MTYRTGLVNTQFIDEKNKYTSDCGWGCMVRCCQMMLSRGFIKKKLYDISLSENNHEIKYNEIRKEILMLFYDKFLNLEKMLINDQICKICKKLLDEKKELVEVIPPYSIYILTILGRCPKVFTSDLKMISCFVKINKTLFNDYIRMIYFNDGTVYKKQLFSTFCKKKQNEEITKNEKFLEFNSEKYIFDKGGLIFITVKLGVRKIESYYREMIPKLFVNLHNNIGFVSGKKKRAFYFIGIIGDKLIFADPHLNQKIDEDEQNFPTYIVNDLFLMSIKELSSEMTVGVAIFSLEELEQFLLDMEWFSQICPGFIGYAK
jgi:hypothetical protein